MVDIENKLAFDRIREMLSELCHNDLSLRMVHDMPFLTSFEHIERELSLTEEMRQILLVENSFPSQDYIDLSDVFHRLKVENTAVQQEELFNLKVSLHTLADILRFLSSDSAEKYPRLRALAEGICVDPKLTALINRIVDDKGEIYDTASDALFDIRRQMKKKTAEVDAQISHFLSKAKREGWAPENAEPTIRNGRPVIPMLDTHRRKIKGIIHDESATRQTAYLEPSEVVELNNDLRGLFFEERRAIQKILLELSDYLRPQLSALLDDYWFLARVDFLRAKAQLALQLHCVRPIVVDCPQLAWLDAFHPLLHRFDASGSSAKPVVPFSLSLDNSARILIVSGPNAGGKSVLLKAVGLIQYMLQCGLLVPCRETSEFGVFGHIFIDIGDQQSIDDDLSTYSSHLLSMKSLLEYADDRTLFLLDELGSGTEPRSGCAIAEALLEELAGRKAFGVVTTHFADLKLLPDKYDCIVNGAMLFDTEKMRPRYILSVGTPGSSFAFEIASNIGLPQRVIDSAGKKVGSQMLNFEHQLQQLELEKKDLERRKTELDVADEFLAEVTAKYQKMTEKVESRRHEILTQARNEARQILADANRKVEQAISDIRKSQADKQKTQEARTSIKQAAEQIEADQDRHDKKIGSLRKESAIHILSDDRQFSEEPDTGAPITVGSIVRIDGNDTFGEVVSIKGRKAVVESNSIRMNIALDRLTSTAKKSIPVDKTSLHNSRFQSIYDDINDRRKSFNPTLDVRGMRADEALDALQHFIDDAQLLGEKELRVLHGKGYGILKQLVRDTLHASPDVVSVRSELLELGGDGITLFSLQ